MPPPQYDVFSGTFGDGDALWLEAVDGLDVACKHAEKQAAKLPGKYFVFCQTTHMVEYTVDTSVPKPEKGRRAAS
jgi:hypothetical protein